MVLLKGGGVGAVMSVGFALLLISAKLQCEAASLPDSEIESRVVDSGGNSHSVVYETGNDRDIRASTVGMGDSSSTIKMTKKPQMTEIEEPSGSEFGEYSLFDFLISAPDFPKDLQISRSLARMEVDTLKDVLETAPDLAVFMPTDTAWEKTGGQILSALTKLTPQASSARRDIFLAASAEVPEGATSWNGISDYARSRDLVLQTAYGSSYIVVPEMRTSAAAAGGKVAVVCEAVYNMQQYEAGDCAEIRLPGIRLSNAHVYATNRVLLPDLLVEDLLNPELFGSQSDEMDDPLEEDDDEEEDDHIEGL